MYDLPIKKVGDTLGKRENGEIYVDLCYCYSERVSINISLTLEHRYWDETKKGKLLPEEVEGGGGSDSATEGRGPMGDLCLDIIGN